MSVTAAPAGQVIFLNGTSSSGKSSIAEQLLLLLERPFFHMSVDTVNGMRAKERTLELSPDELAAVLTRTRAGFHRAVAGMARAGNDVVVDYVLSERWRMLDCLTVLDRLDVVFVGVRCSARELARRERARGDRQPGQAASQLGQVHSYGGYDIECDTTAASPRDCARLIIRSLDQQPSPRAFDRLRAARDHDHEGSARAWPRRLSSWPSRAGRRGHGRPIYWLMPASAPGLGKIGCWQYRYLRLTTPNHAGQHPRRHGGRLTRRRGHGAAKAGLCGDAAHSVFSLDQGQVFAVMPIGLRVRRDLAAH